MGKWLSTCQVVVTFKSVFIILIKVIIKQNFFTPEIIKIFMSDWVFIWCAVPNAVSLDLIRQVLIRFFGYIPGPILGQGVKASRSTACLSYAVLHLSKSFLGMYCLVTHSFLRQYQKCRFDKCLKVGMDPKWVLNDKQKKIRFRKFFENKDKVKRNYLL